MAATGFYVYEHIRKDTGAVFYVGKGIGRRLVCTQHKNKHWTAVANKHGWEARIVFHAPDEEFALLYEQELISRHRWLGSPLTNMTDGGEGMSGYKFSEQSITKRSLAQTGQIRPSVSEKLKGVPKSAEHCRKLSLARMGKKASKETRLAMSIARKGRVSGMKGKKHTEDSKRKISLAITGDKNPFYGKTHTQETIDKIKLANIGRKDSVETRLKKSLSKKGALNNRYGKHIPEEQKLRQIATLKARPRVTCIHCGKTMDEANAKRWHGDNCRSKL